MGRKKTPGLVKRGRFWYIDKWVDGVRISGSTGSNQLVEAEKFLARRLETHRQAKVYGVRPKRIFKEAAVKFLIENQQKKSIHSDAGRLKVLDSYIGNLPLDAIHMGTLQPFIDARRKEGVKTRTINHGLKVVRHILNLSTSEWIDEYGLSWLVAAPKIKLLPELDGRNPNPLKWEEQERLFAALPDYLHDMALFAVNTGCRDQEICRLEWGWEEEVPIPEIGSVFIIPGEYTKNGQDRLIVLNHIARKVIERRRNLHPTFVFTYNGQRLSRMTNKAWFRAREKVGLDVRVHDLKHTFGSRLRAADVSLEDRQDLLGHKSTRITTHYSRATLLNLWEATNKVCEENRKSTLTVLRTARVKGSGNSVPQKSHKGAMAYFLGVA